MTVYSTAPLVGDPAAVAFATLRDPSDRDAGDAACSRCATVAPLTAVSAAVSRTFTGYDSWADKAGAGLCPACCWLYSTPQLRMLPHRITTNPATLTTPRLHDLVAELAAGPLDPGVAIAVPLRPGRKHLFPHLAWGTIRVDDENLTWTAADARLVRHVVDLRGRGFGPRMLLEPVPTYQVLRRQPFPDWPALIDQWRALDQWRRHHPAYLDLAIAVTRPDPAGATIR